MSSIRLKWFRKGIVNEESFLWSSIVNKTPSIFGLRVIVNSTSKIPKGSFFAGINNSVDVVSIWESNEIIFELFFRIRSKKR